MICFNCGNILTNSDYCSQCGMDVSVYKKVVKLSNAYYNAGLIKANNRDLAGAADSLNRAIKINKRQIDARNLLGLVYYEMGETVQAFREWVVSLNIQPDNNSADRYLKAIQSDKNKIDELNHTIRKFNVALAYAQNGTDDMAIIQLKKVLNQNPRLVKGHQLLCVLYMKQGEYEKAKKAVMKSLKIDRCNPLSIRYLREINEYLDDEKKNNPEERGRRIRANRGINIDREPLSGNDVIIPKNNFKEAVSSAQSILNIVLGMIIGAAMVYFIVTPARISYSTEEVKAVKSEYEQKIAIQNSSISELQRQVEDLNTEIDEAQIKYDHQKGKNNSIVANYSNLIQAATCYINEEHTKSIEFLGKIDSKVKMNSEAFTELYNTLNENLADVLAETYYNNGLAAQNDGDIDKSIEWFKKCLEVDDQYADAYYHLGWVYSQKGDNDKAQEMFQKIVDDFPSYESYDVAKAQVSNGTE